MAYKSTCTFVLTQKEEAILYHIKDVLGVGVVKNFGKFYRYIVRDKKSIEYLIYIFNGNLFLDKRKVQLNK
jgi:LAGLIDADG endonuclease